MTVQSWQWWTSCPKGLENLVILSKTSILTWCIQTHESIPSRCLRKASGLWAQWHGSAYRRILRLWSPFSAYYVQAPNICASCVSVEFLWVRSFSFPGSTPVCPGTFKYLCLWSGTLGVTWDAYRPVPSVFLRILSGCGGCQVFVSSNEDILIKTSVWLGRFTSSEQKIRRPKNEKRVRQKINQEINYLNGEGRKFNMLFSSEKRKLLLKHKDMFNICFGHLKHIQYKKN